jgi:VWFA-related protein
MRLTRIGLWLATLMPSLFILAQEQPLSFKVDVDVVNVLATVRDRSGGLISDLIQDDFILEDNGQKQEIRYFSRQTDLPLTIGLLIDTSDSQDKLLAEECSASSQFFNHVIRPDCDQAFLIKFDAEAELLQDLTPSLSSLQKALDSLNPLPIMRDAPKPDGRRIPPGAFPAPIPPPGGPHLPGSGWRGGPMPNRTGVSTALYDAVSFASDKILRHREGRKAIILISDGVDVGSKLCEKDAIEAAHRAGTIIYSIRYFDFTAYSAGSLVLASSKGTNALNDLSKETGGRLFQTTRKLQLKDIYDIIQEELRNQYNLGYAPPQSGSSEFHRIKLRTKDGKFEVVTRAGYYSKK